jgi:molybdate transport system ATP-binding protein
MPGKPTPADVADEYSAADPIVLQLDNEVLFSGKWPGRWNSALSPITWTWRRGESWVFLGDNGSGKTSFMELVQARAGKTARSVSCEALERIMAEQIRQDDSNFIGRIDTGAPLYRFLGLESPHEPLPVVLPDDAVFGLLDQGIRTLSTGEMRRALIYRAILARPSVLLLDEPFDGLDVAATATMRELICGLIDEGQALLMMLNRRSDLLPEHTHVGVFRGGSLVFSGSREEWQQHEIVRVRVKTPQPGSGLTDFSESFDSDPKYSSIPGPPQDRVRLQHNSPLVTMRKVTVRYGEKTILDGFCWQVNQGEHWKISGPNGVGKTTLLNLVSGDHPQAYCNDISLFGRRRGTGESVWDIKQKVGIVSPDLQLSYRVSVSARLCILSGLFDSIGVYDPVSPMQRELANQWLSYLGMQDRADRPLRHFSYGEQRMLLIARGLIKHPPLLILDEPCQGLDDHNRTKVLRLLGEFAAGSESTLLYVTHRREDEIEGIRRHLDLSPA